jgi:DNA-binding GntR family transcriptional regulator
MNIRVAGMAADISTPEVTGQQSTRLISDQAYFELRDRIVTLRLPPGTALIEDELMRELGIGRTPLREAVKRLALENLLEIRPRRGTYVTEVEAPDIVHITEVRADLEGHAAELAAARMDGGRRAQVEALRGELDRLEAEEGDTLMHVDERVHRLVWESSGNPYLVDTLEGYFALSLRVWYLVLDRVPRLGASVRDQAALLDALLAGDGARARELMREHVLEFQREIVLAFER